VHQNWGFAEKNVQDPYNAEYIPNSIDCKQGTQFGKPSYPLGISLPPVANEYPSVNGDVVYYGGLKKNRGHIEATSENSATNIIRRKNLKNTFMGT
jgi:hypothetical protein